MTKYQKIFDKLYDMDLTYKTWNFITERDHGTLVDLFGSVETPEELCEYFEQSKVNFSR